jgi:hypothetical protein
MSGELEWWWLCGGGTGLLGGGRGCQRKHQYKKWGAGMRFAMLEEGYTHAGSSTASCDVTGRHSCPH